MMKVCHLFSPYSLYISYWSRPHIVSAVRHEDDFPQQRNDAREILATLPTSRLEDLARDIWCELAERFPAFNEEVSFFTSKICPGNLKTLSGVFSFRGTLTLHQDLISDNVSSDGNVISDIRIYPGEQ
jgi:hypothetical protein